MSWSRGSRDYPFPFLKRFFGWTPFFNGPIYGPCMLAGGIIIAIMILPIITSVSREILRSVPDLQREAAYAMGATRWEVTRVAVLSYARKGLFGAVILGLGRALGETMAVTMVIGNTPQIAASLFKPGYTLASVIANEFTEATTDVYLGALFEIGLVLFGVTILVNLIAQLLLKPSRQHHQRAPCNVMHPKRADNHRWRKVKNALASTAAFVSAFLVIPPLGLVFFHLLVNGISSVNWDFFTNLPKPVGEAGGGMVNAIAGSLELLALAATLEFPLAYWAEFIWRNMGQRALIGCCDSRPMSSTAFHRLPGALSFTDLLYCVSKAFPLRRRPRAWTDYDSTHSAHD